MKIGDRVTTDKVLRVNDPQGSVIKKTGDYPYGYVVIKWDDINGHWHYTYEQIKKIKKIE